jgi:predicted RNA binding protein YcfA (HicA-like mRNA interferase family)
VPSDLYKRVARILAAHGFWPEKQEGSHEIWRNAARRPVSVPVSGKSRHTMNAILKSAGIDAKI